MRTKNPQTQGHYEQGTRLPLAGCACRALGLMQVRRGENEEEVDWGRLLD